METPNLNYIEALSGGDITFKAKLIEVIKNEFPKESEAYFSNITQKNHQKAADDVHKLKHKISILGLEKSYEVAIEYEEALREGDLNLETQFQKILTSITLYLTKLE